MLVRVERLREEFDPGSTLPLTAIAAYLDIVAAFMHTEKAACCRVALAVSRGHLHSIV